MRLTYVEFKLTYNNQEFWGHQKIMYYPKIEISDLSQHTFTQSQNRLVVTVYGRHFINTANNLMCQLGHTERPIERHLAEYVRFESPQQIYCAFDMQIYLHSGFYTLSVSNNLLQYAEYTVTSVEVHPAILIINIWPKTVLSRTVALESHKVTLEAIHLRDDCECFFLTNSTDQAALFKMPSETLIVPGTLLNQTHMTCQVPLDYTDLGTTYINVRIGFESNVKTISESSIALKITDQCPDGYFCQDYFMQECPTGHYCRGGAFEQQARPCPVGYYQSKKRSIDCMPCLKGHYCPDVGMPEPTPCPIGYMCDVHKLTSPRAECPAGFYCVEATQGN